jgi:hypothetical protein
LDVRSCAAMKAALAAQRQLTADDLTGRFG